MYQNRLLESNISCPLTQDEGNKSYHSQYNEDFILSIIFQDQNVGTYVDIGANDPDHWSNTRHFYDKGWSGINIEPQTDLFNKFLVSRKRDINLNIGISDSPGQIDFYQMYQYGRLNSVFTTSDQKLAMFYASQPAQSMHIFSVKVRTATDVLKQYKFKNIDFISIDVENLEEKVLKSIDFKQFRPKVILIEAIDQRNFKKDFPWEDIILQNQYHYQMQDGFNRYYVSYEAELQLKNNFMKADNCYKSKKVVQHMLQNPLESKKLVQNNSVKVSKVSESVNIFVIILLLISAVFLLRRYLFKRKYELLQQISISTIDLEKEEKQFIIDSN